MRCRRLLEHLYVWQLVNRPAAQEADAAFFNFFHDRPDIVLDSAVAAPHEQRKLLPAELTRKPKLGYLSPPLLHYPPHPYVMSLPALPPYLAPLRNFAHYTLTLWPRPGLPRRPLRRSRSRLVTAG